MTDISTAVLTAMNNLVASGKIEAAIEKQLEATIADLIRDHLRSYSEFGKALSGHIKTSIGVNLDHITLPEYNAVVAEIVTRKVDDFIVSEGRKELESTLSEMLKAAPAEMKFSKLVEEFKEWAVEQWDFEPSEDGQITAILDDDGGRWSSRHIYLDPKAGKKKYECQFSLLLSGDGTVSHIRMGGHNTKDHVFIGGYYGFERTLFRLHAAKTKLIVDAFDVYLPERDAA